MANIISSICFSNSNNDSANNGGDFKVGVCAKLAWVCVSLFLFPKLRRLTCLLLRRAGSPASRRPICFPQRHLPRGVELGWAAKVSCCLCSVFATAGKPTCTNLLLSRFCHIGTWEFNCEKLFLYEDLCVLTLKLTGWHNWGFSCHAHNREVVSLIPRGQGHSVCHSPTGPQCTSLFSQDPPQPRVQDRHQWMINVLISGLLGSACNTKICVLKTSLSPGISYNGLISRVDVQCTTSYKRNQLNRKNRLFQNQCSSENPSKMSSTNAHTHLDRVFCIPRL